MSGRQNVIYILLALFLMVAIVEIFNDWNENSINKDSTSSNLKVVFQDDFENVLFNNRTNLSIPTYDGSGQMVHPDVYYNGSRWNGYKYWMVMCPYPNSNYTFENPSIVVSNDSIDWQVPLGLVNPIDPTPHLGPNSDPNIAFKDNTLYVYYREVNRTYNILRMRNSTDGINWSNEYTSLALPNHLLVSPSILYNSSDNKFYMWYVDTGMNGSEATLTRVLMRYSTDGINFGDPQNVTIPLSGRIIWHINVEYISSIDEYWMIISAGTKKADAQNELFFAYSKDKLNWSVLSGKIIGIGRNNGWDDNRIYQASINYIDDTVKIWYSAWNNSRQWHIGYAETSLDDLKKDHKWNYNGVQNKGYLTRSTDYVKDGKYSAKIEFDGLLTETVGIIRNIGNTNHNINYEIDIYDNNNTPSFKMFRVTNQSYKNVGIGVWTNSSTTRYVYHSMEYRYNITDIPRSVGWHRLKISFTEDKTIRFFIDGVYVGMLTDQFNDPINVLLNGYRWADVFFVDNLKVYVSDDS